MQLTPVFLFAALFMASAYGAAVKIEFLCNDEANFHGIVKNGVFGIQNCNTAAVTPTINLYNSAGTLLASYATTSYPAGWSWTSANGWKVFALTYSSYVSPYLTVQSCYGGSCYNATWPCTGNAGACNPNGPFDCYHTETAVAGPSCP